MDKFFIIGLPRSRTYWLSEFLGCLHEGLYYYPNYNDLMKSNHIGDSTTCYMQIKDFIKNEKKVIIHRNIDDVEDSLAELFGKIDAGFLIEMEKELKAEDGLHIRYEDISDRLEDIWSFCRNDIFPKKRAEEMDGQVLENMFLIEEAKNAIA